MATIISADWAKESIILIKQFEIKENSRLITKPDLHLSQYTLDARKTSILDQLSPRDSSFCRKKDKYVSEVELTAEGLHKSIVLEEALVIDESDKQSDDGL